MEKIFANLPAMAESEEEQESSVQIPFKNKISSARSSFIEEQQTDRRLIDDPSSADIVLLPVLNKKPALIGQATLLLD